MENRTHLSRLISRKARAIGSTSWSQPSEKPKTCRPSCRSSIRVHAPAGGFDAAVVAGNVHMPRLRALDWLGDRLPGVPVVYVPGNHDF